MDRILDYDPAMEIRELLANNLKALIDYAKENGGQFKSQYALSNRGIIGQATANRILQEKGGDTKISTIAQLANAYGLEVHQFLIPALDPDPKKRPIVISGEALEKRIKEGIDARWERIQKEVSSAPHQSEIKQVPSLNVRIPPNFELPNVASREILEADGSEQATLVFFETLLGIAQAREFNLLVGLLDDCTREARKHVENAAQPRPESEVTNIQSGKRKSAGSKSK